MRSKNIPYMLLSILLVLSAMLMGCDAAPKVPEGVEAAPASKPTPAANPGDIAAWPVYRDEQYGFSFAYPEQWAYKVIEQGGPGMPEDWPVKAGVLFFPQTMAEQLNRSGPPDPNAPPVIPPVQLEICVGPQEQFRRAYPEPGAAEEMEVNGLKAVLERDTYDDFNSHRYVFTHPADETVRVILIDAISGFSERAEANPEFVALIPHIVASFTFDGGQPATGAPSQQYAPVTLAEAGLRFEVPAGWTQLAPEWAWSPGSDASARVAVRWVELAPPQEPEAALLPQPAQILSTEALTLAGDVPARSFEIEVYGPAQEGDDGRAPVQAVERHALFVLEGSAGRRAYDVFASAPDPESLAALRPALDHLLATLAWDDVPAAVLDQIRLQVAAQLNAESAALELTLRPTEFPDACLGLPGDGVCAQMITPGYLGRATLGERVYEVRASQDGGQVRVVEPTG